ncbi:glycosyltransferase family 2 protein [Niallia sp. Sow4_A1]|uniref:glycosyltransferase family 2 protein n=1 Tax=Niallia sp. Sow4_A1 TaxID=3438793 RepID=UPI003F9C363C
MNNQYTPLISVVIPTYNRASIILRTLDSVFAQTYKNYEVIVVDDASIDDTENVIKNIKNNRVKFIKHEYNMNGSKARNTGILKSSGEYIAFLDSDDEWKPTKLEEQISHIMNTYPNREDIVSYTSLIANRGASKIVMPKRGIQKDENVLDYLFLEDGVMQTSTIMIHRSLAKKVLFNEHLKRHQDWDFCNRLQEYNAKIIFVNKPLSIWNIEYRKDRMSNENKYIDSIKWISSQNKISKVCELAFMVKVVAPFMGRSGKKFEAYQLLFKASRYKIINLKQLIVIWLKITFSLNTLNKLHKTFNSLK